MSKINQPSATTSTSATNRTAETGSSSSKGAGEAAGGSKPRPSSMFDALRTRSSTNSLPPRASIAEISGAQSKKPFHESYYAQSVSLVNSLLQQAGMGITASSSQSVKKNLEDTVSGKLSYTAAHAAEVKNFALDTAAHLTTGKYKDAALTATGAAVNAAALFTVGGAMDAEKERQSTDLAKMVEAAAKQHDPQG
jgi:hypothetical protein